MEIDLYYFREEIEVTSVTPALNLSNITSKIPNTATFRLVGLEHSVSKYSTRTTRNVEKDINLKKNKT